MRGAMRGLAARRASPSEEVSSRKEERYETREGSSERDEASICCIFEAIFKLDMILNVKVCLRLKKLANPVMF